jgi:hypothetical protein
MPVNVIHNKGECMHERKNEESIGDPSVKDLKPLMRNTRKECDPIRLARRCTSNIST